MATEEVQDQRFMKKAAKTWLRVRSDSRIQGQNSDLIIASLGRIFVRPLTSADNMRSGQGEELALDFEWEV